MLQLNDQVFWLIFKYFDIQELMQMKLICKRFKHLIEGLKFKELIVKEENFINYWYHNNQPVRLKNTISHFNIIKLFSNPKFRETFQNLKSLKALLPVNFDLELFNLFPLEHLEFDSFIYLNRKKVLRLPNLKTCKILALSYVEMDTIRLESLYCANLSLLKIMHPQSIKYLEVENLKNNCDLKEFTNLKILNSNVILNENVILNSFENLEKIYVHSAYEGDSFVNDNMSINTVKKIFDDISRYDVRVFYQGIEIKRNFSLYFDKDSMAMIKNYYDQLDDNLSKFRFINYSKLIELFANQIPPCFFNKFINVTEINLCRLTCQSDIDQNQFFDFLSKCTKLSKLKLESPQFNQEFYDKLPDICCLLESFELTESNIEQLNYDFVLKLKIIKIFDINQRLDLKLIINLLKNPRKSVKFFRTSNVTERVSLIRRSNEAVMDFYFKRKKWLGIGINELIRLCEDLDSKNSNTRIFSTNKKQRVCF